jgi:hypothetical protein
MLVSTGAPNHQQFVSDEVARAVFGQWIDGIDRTRLANDENAKRSSLLPGSALI